MTVTPTPCLLCLFNRTFESAVLSKLLDWASVSLEKSLNQPMLPHAIIALNATDLGVNQLEWDFEYATNQLLNSMARVILRDSAYREHVKYWSNDGRKIATMEDLLNCYYSSFTVVRIPVKNHYMRVETQVRMLYDRIINRCAQSRATKRQSSMLSDANELNIYLQSAFDHFSEDLRAPFNFVDVSCRLNPVPANFGGNIVQLAVALRRQRRFDSDAYIFQDIAPFVASCVLLDSARKGLKGSASPLMLLRMLC